MTHKFEEHLGRCEDRGTFHYLGVCLSRKGRNIGIIFFKFVRRYRCQLKKHAEIWTLFWRNAAKLLRRVKDKLQLFYDFVVY